ncbi:MAG: sigma-54-dependent Fis family transcriptional regulator [Fibrobacter sp.]|nr:sigma-54-dependent Fis family transcriptional regulator [Fibrobacter sp.]
MLQLLDNNITADSYTVKFMRPIISRLQLTPNNTIEQRQLTTLEKRNNELRKLIINGGRIDGIIGNSNIMQDLYRTIIQNIFSGKDVLIHGEPGTEIDLVAQAFYTYHSEPDTQFLHFKKEQFKPVQVGSGITNQSFSFRTILENYDCPLVLYFSNLADIDTATIKDLLRIIKSRSESFSENNIQIVGALQNIDINKRVLPSPLKELLSILYCNLITIPPLRTRGADILLLTNHFLKKYCSIYKKEIKSISAVAADFLLNYRWPGNIKELETMVENTVRHSEQPVISAYDFYVSLKQKQTSERSCVEDVPFGERISLYEKELIINALRKSNGNQAQAALLLRLTKRILQYKIEKYAIDCKKFRVSVTPKISDNDYNLLNSVVETEESIKILPWRE